MADWRVAGWNRRRRLLCRRTVLAPALALALCIIVMLDPAGGAAFAQADLRVGGEWQTVVSASSTQGEWAGAIESLVRLELQLAGDPWRLDAGVTGKASGGLGGGGGDWQVGCNVERLSLKVFLGDVDVSLGKQQISWGVGYAWSPTDVFTPLDPAGAGQSRPGINAAAVKIHAGPLAYWNLVAAEDTKGSLTGQRPWRYGARWHGNVGGTDTSLAVATHSQTTMVGADIKGDLGAVGWHGEAAYFVPRDEGWPACLEGVLGADLSWDGGRIVWAAEYLYSSRGAATRDEYDYMSWLTGRQRHLARHYAFSQVVYRRDDFTSVSGSALVNLVDGSAVVTAGVDTLLGGDWRLALSATALAGEEGDEFGRGVIPGIADGHPDMTLKAQLGYSF